MTEFVDIQNKLIKEAKRACSLTFMLKKSKKITVTAVAVLISVLTIFSTVIGSAATTDVINASEPTAVENESAPVYESTAPTDADSSNEIFTGKVTINRETLTLGVGEGFALTAGIIETNNSNQTVTWKSSNKNAATVDSKGSIKAVGAGTSLVTPTLKNGSNASCNVTVKKAPTNVYLNKTSLTLGVGEQYDLNSSFKNGEGARVIDYTTNNSSVASVKKAGGLVTANKVGTATITATTYNGIKVTCTVTVKKAPTSITLNKKSLTLGIGEQYDLNSSLKNGEGAHSIVYTSNNTSVASVKASGGLVTANKEGTAVITATAYNGKKVTCKITVKKAPTKLSLNKTSLSLNVGEKFDLNSSLNSGEAAHSIVYSSSNTSVASVKAAGGMVTANKEGTAVITATAYNGVKVTCKVTVSKRSYTDDDLYCLAAVIWQEAGASWASDRLQLMVANVVMNHVESPYFPNTIRGVLTRPYAYGTMAWTGIKLPTANDPITQAAIDRCYANAKKILDGYRLLPSNVIYQAGFVQGSGVYAYESGVYFCYM